MSKSASISAVVLSAALGLSAAAQTSQTSATPPQTNTSNTANTAANPNDSSTYATGKPLPTKSNEGFWGHLNPLARKKWVNRQVSPVKDRLNELDQLTAKNSSDIKDVDARAQAGIHQAQTTADQANQQAIQANTQANQAQQTATQASSQTAQLNTTVSNLDQYQQVSDTEIRFRRSQTALNQKAKEALDEMANMLAGQKGYIVEVQGYSPSRDLRAFRDRRIWPMQWSGTWLSIIKCRFTGSIALEWAMLPVRTQRNHATAARSYT